MTESVLIPHKSFVKLEGKIVGMDRDNFFMEGKSKKNNNPWKRINFGIMTSPTNKVWVELMGNVMPKAYAYNKKEKKSMPVDWSKRLSAKLPDGYEIIETDWDKIDRIRKEFNNGEDVVLIGEIKYSEYNGQLQERITIKNIYPSSREINFEDEDFAEVNTFTQELTVTGTEYDKDEGKLYLNTYIIENRGKKHTPNIQPAVFVIYPERDKAFANTISKMKFGDTVKVQGIIHNRVVTEEIEQSDGWGTVTTVITNTKKELEVYGAFSETYQEKMYKESDFDEALAEKQAREMFGEDNDKWGSINDDDLPF